MSDMYLLLRRRLDEVAKWTSLDTATLKSAREAKGLSYEGVARLVGVSSKTWERYEKSGRVATHALPRVAEVLDLEIERVPARTVTVEEDPVLDELRRMAARLEAAVLDLEELVDSMGVRVPCPSDRLPDP